ncbi:jg26242 [Pararge aegeria aegeria]|uniref:Jg26242 protein n=1 Tax=Pararge aegeria aegeria TaxID=348720 RepID=A0A8S4QRB0_9NEOP|nr:jg26242 [Pararge aegeria aegeria]
MLSLFVCRTVLAKQVILSEPEVKINNPGAIGDFCAYINSYVAASDKTTNWLYNTQLNRSENRWTLGYQSAGTTTGQWTASVNAAMVDASRLQPLESRLFSSRRQSLEVMMTMTNTYCSRYKAASE